MPPILTREEVAGSLAQLLGTAEIVLVAVDGRGGSGKSVLGEWLAESLGGQVIHIDDFGHPAKPIDEWDWARLERDVLDPLTSGSEPGYQRFDWNSMELTEWVAVEAKGLVIIEGVSALRVELNDPWSYRIWVEAPYELRLERGIERDGEAMRSTWVERWMPQEDAYVDAQRPEERADAIVRGYPSTH